MKKGLLSILAGALLVVGCQNYDDQFDQLENQISALSSTVAGLSQVQSDLSALAGTVNSLQSALSSQIDTALADGLADIDAAVADLEAATADAASADAVQEIADAVAENQTDLEELLAQSSVFQGSVVVKTPAMLDAYHAMGDGLGIINGSVEIENTSAMDQTKVQELVNFILVTTGDYKFTAMTGVDNEITFSNLTGTQSLTLDQEGGYMLENLESATIIELDDDSSVDVVHLGSLTSATSLSDGSGAGTFTFAKGTELHLTSLPRSPSTALSLGVDEGGVIALDALTDTDAAGDDTKLNLTIAGPASFTLPAGVSGDKSGSTLAVSEVGTLTVNGYDGAITIDQDVLNFSSDNVVALTINGDDLVSVDITGVLDPNATTADTEGPAISLTGQGDLETVNIDGTTDTIVIGTSSAGNGNLVSVTIAGTVIGTAGIAIANNSDLTTVDVSGATTDKLVIDGNSDLEALTVDFTTAKGKATTQEGNITVNNNESLESLTVSTDNVDNLTITNNADLETIDLSGMTAIGATGTASVTIHSNDLTAEKSDNQDDGDTDVADGKSGDLGSFTTASGMDTAKAYLTAVAADADSKASVVFDTVDSAVSNETASETDLGSDITTGANTQVLVLTPKNVTTASKDATRHRHVLAVANTATGTLDIFFADKTRLMDAAATHDANEVLYIAEITDATNLTRADAYGVTLAAYEGAFPTGVINFQASVLTATADDSSTGADPKVSVAHVVSTTDVVNLTVDGVLLSGTVAALDALDTAGNNTWNPATVTAPTIDELIEIVANAWQETYVLAAAASDTTSLFKVNSDTGNDQLDITAKDGSGRRGFDKSYSFTVTAASSTLASAVYGVYYGATTASGDNNTISNGVIVTVEADTGGYILDETKGLYFVANLAAATQTVTTDLYAGFQLGTTTLLANAGTNLTSSTDIHPDEARGDAVKPEANVAEVADAATSFNRVGWL